MLELKACQLQDVMFEAGEIAMRYWRNDPENWQKDDEQGPVSEADLAVNAYLVKTLSTLDADAAILSEEMEDDLSRLQSAKCWVIDPIDGTKAYLKGENYFSISVALVENGRPIWGGIYAPALNQYYHARKDQGAFCGDAQLQISKVAIDQATILASRAKYNRDILDHSPALNSTFRPSIALRMAMVASGEFDGSFGLRPSWDWDIAAGDLIITEAGGKVVDQNGQIPRYNQLTPQQNGIVAGSPDLVKSILKRIKEVRS